MSRVPHNDNQRGVIRLEEAPAECELQLPRVKGYSWAVPIAYRLKAVLVGILGPVRTLRLLLNSSWLLHRLAYELSGRIWGEAFHCTGMAISRDLLHRWIPAGGAVIDIGCGSGRWCRVAATFAGRVCGIDRDAHAIAMARSLCSDSRIDYVVGEASQALGMGPFDVALLVHVLEHLDDAVGFLIRLRQVAPRLIVEVPDFEADPLNLIRMRLQCPFYSDADHVREFTASLLEAHLLRAGWQPVTVQRRGSAVAMVAESNP